MVSSITTSLDPLIDKIGFLEIGWHGKSQPNNYV
jgi:hypothetical protein